MFMTISLLVMRSYMLPRYVLVSAVSIARLLVMNLPTSRGHTPSDSDSKARGTRHTARVLVRVES